MSTDNGGVHRKYQNTEQAFEKMKKNLLRSVMVGVCLYIATILAIFTVSGDGRAPTITTFLIAAMLMPMRLFGLSLQNGPWALILGAFFWTIVIFALLSLVYGLAQISKKES